MAGGGKPKFYGVAAGRKPGVYTDWPTTQAQISGFSGAKHKSFKTKEEAEAFVRGISAPISLRGDLSTSRSPSATDHLDRSTEVSESAPKRQKKEDASPAPLIDNQNIKFEPGLGPLPLNAVDGFDPSLKLDDKTGNIRIKTDEELGKRKRQPTGDFKGPVVVYTDGGSRGNGNAGAKAGCGVYFGPRDPRSVSWQQHVLQPGAFTDVEHRNVQEPLKGDVQTNNRAELVAMARAIDHVPIDRDLHIISDSEYSKNCLTSWVAGWERNGWRNSKNKEVVNKDIIQPILARIREREKCNAKTLITWVKAHAIDEGNIAADALANQGMDKWTTELASGEVFDMSETLRTKYRNPNDPKDEFDDAEEIEGLFREMAEENPNGFEGDPLAQHDPQPNDVPQQGVAAAAQELESAWPDDPQLSSYVNGEHKEPELGVTN
jgi:ribonuclease HI